MDEAGVGVGDGDGDGDGDGVCVASGATVGAVSVKLLTLFSGQPAYFFVDEQYPPLPHRPTVWPNLARPNLVPRLSEY